MLTIPFTQWIGKTVFGWGEFPVEYFVLGSVDSRMVLMPFSKALKAGAQSLDVKIAVLSVDKLFPSEGEAVLDWVATKYGQLIKDGCPEEKIKAEGVLKQVEHLLGKYPSSEEANENQAAFIVSLKALKDTISETLAGAEKRLQTLKIEQLLMRLQDDYGISREAVIERINEEEEEDEE